MRYRKIIMKYLLFIVLFLSGCATHHHEPRVYMDSYVENMFEYHEDIRNIEKLKEAHRNWNLYLKSRNVD